MKTLIIEPKYNNKNLITYLTNIFPDLKTSSIYKALRKKDIRLNGKRISQNVTLQSGDKIDVYIVDSELYGVNLLDIKTVYEDENIVVFNKPINLEVVGDFSLTSIKKNDYKFLEPCHRIDRNTIGLVLFAKNQESLDILLDKFKNKEIEKHYICLCYGIPLRKSYNMEAYLFKDSKKSIVYISDEFKKGYSKILTSYQVIDTNKSKMLSLLNVTLHTGKTHQIRAHLAHIGLPILGDGKYGSYEINKKFGVHSQLLCSYSLKFNFSNDSKSLDYLNGKEIRLKELPFTQYL